jgi:hypothetical protein
VALRDEADRVLQAVASLRESSSRLRGDAKAEALAALSGLDHALTAAIRLSAPGEWIASLGQEAADDLSPFKARLTSDAWARSIDITVDRLLRDRFGLPHLAP